MVGSKKPPAVAAGWGRIRSHPPTRRHVADYRSRACLVGVPQPVETRAKYMKTELNSAVTQNGNLKKLLIFIS